MESVYCAVRTGPSTKTYVSSLKSYLSSICPSVSRRHKNAQLKKKKNRILTRKAKHSIIIHRMVNVAVTFVLQFKSCSADNSLGLAQSLRVNAGTVFETGFRVLVNTFQFMHRPIN